MTKLFQIASAVLVCAAVASGCSESSAQEGCVIEDVTLDQCLTTSNCPDCSTVCEERDGTRAGGPSCEQIIGFGFFCVCSCEFCFGNDGGSPGMSEDARIHAGGRRATPVPVKASPTGLGLASGTRSPAP